MDAISLTKRVTSIQLSANKLREFKELGLMRNTFPLNRVRKTRRIRFVAPLYMSYVLLLLGREMVSLGSNRFIRRESIFVQESCALPGESFNTFVGR